MTEAQKRLRELRDRQSRERQRMAELSREESLTDETRGELDTWRAARLTWNASCALRKRRPMPRAMPRPAPPRRIPKCANGSN